MRTLHTYSRTEHSTMHMPLSAHNAARLVLHSQHATLISLRPALCALTLSRQGVHMLRLEPVLRGCLTKALQAAAHPDLTFSLVLSGFHLLQYACPANHPLQASDIHVRAPRTARSGY